MMEWVIIECGKCGCNFQVTEHWNKDKRESRATFFCPNGHPRAYVESEADKLRRERDLLTQRIAEKDDEIALQRRHREETERSLAATKGVVTRIRNRVGHGVCPCCNRSFADLRRHIETKHPTFTAEAAE